MSRSWESWESYSNDYSKSETNQSETTVENPVINIITDRVVFDFNLPENKNIDIKDIESILHQVQLQIDERTFLGELFDTETKKDTIYLSNVSHFVSKLKIENNILYADINILSTPRGNTLQKLYDLNKICNLDTFEFKPRFRIENNVLRKIFAIDVKIKSEYIGKKSSHNVPQLIENINPLTKRLANELFKNEIHSDTLKRTQVIIPKLAGKLVKILIENKESHIIEDSFVAEFHCNESNQVMIAGFHDMNEEKNEIRTKLMQSTFQSKSILGDMTIRDVLTDKIIHIVIIPQ